MTSSRYDDDLRLALILADQVDSITMSRFKAIDLKVESKPDTTPVTDADRTVEEVIRTQLSRSRSRDAIVGEEYGTTGHSSRRWIIDPIDGTKNFVRGVPVWATLIALAEGDDIVVSVVSAPALNRRWWAAKGAGAWTGRSLANATRLSVSKVARIEDASISYASLNGWKDLGLYDQFLSLTDEVWRSRAYGDFWSYMLVAEGAVDAAMEPELELYDMAALVAIVTEAGGTFTSVDGSYEGPWGPNAVASNGLLHRDILERLTPAMPATGDDAWE
ncbi:inositol monophosphatase family protein [Timonella senegalensis]|jgi:histidinol-phosphatase|uniref:inositol monophosphatase family protein n=1 Tax=Timonella senegalensis TaxID=1465825 RepID=UPI0028A62474|nr:inositol monophosphatase family protein [Timonella senegalensis]